MNRLAFLLIFFVIGSSYGAPTDADVVPERVGNEDEDAAEYVEETTILPPVGLNASSTIKADLMTLEPDVVGVPIQENSLATFTMVPQELEPAPAPAESLKSKIVVTEVFEPKETNMDTKSMPSTTTTLTGIALDPVDTFPAVSVSTTTPVYSDAESMTSDNHGPGFEINFPTFFSQFGKMYAAMMEAKSRDHEHKPAPASARGETQPRDYETPRDQHYHRAKGDEEGSVVYVGARVMPRFEDDPYPTVKTFTPESIEPIPEPTTYMTEPNVMTTYHKGPNIYPAPNANGNVENLAFHEEEPEIAAGYYGKCRHNRVAPLYTHTPYYIFMLHIPLPIFHPVTYEGMAGGYVYNTNNNNNNNMQPYTPVGFPNGKM